MATLTFKLNNAEAVVAHLEQTLQVDIKHTGDGIVIEFDDVKEDLALWLLTYGIAYHGLQPKVVPLPPNRIVMERRDNSNEDVLEGRSVLPVSKAKLPEAKKADK